MCRHCGDPECRGFEGFQEEMTQKAQEIRGKVALSRERNKNLTGDDAELMERISKIEEGLVNLALQATKDERSVEIAQLLMFLTEVILGGPFAVNKLRAAMTIGSKVLEQVPEDIAGKIGGIADVIVGGLGIGMQDADGNITEVEGFPLLNKKPDKKKLH